MQSKFVLHCIAATFLCGLLAISHVAHHKNQARLVLVEQSGDSDAALAAGDATQMQVDAAQAHATEPTKKVLYSAEGLAYPAKANKMSHKKGERFAPGSGMFSTDPRMTQKEEKGAVFYSSQGLGYSAEPKAATNTRFLSGSGMYSTDVRFRHAKIQQKALQANYLYFLYAVSDCVSHELDYPTQSILILDVSH
jgi:hypothetical protein